MVAQEKCEGPVTTITYIGNEIDSLSHGAKIIRGQTVRIRGELGKWIGKKAGRR